MNIITAIELGDGINLITNLHGHVLLRVARSNNIHAISYLVHAGVASLSLLLLI